MTPKEMLELAAKAAGIEGSWERDKNTIQDRWYFNVQYDNHGMLTGFEWNPLRDDGDALRLAVKLGLCVSCHNDAAVVSYAHPRNVFRELHANDPLAATRRAIVRAAAEIGRAMG